MNFFYSPFIIPVVGMMIPIVAIISKAVSDVHAHRIKADQRMAMLQRGMSPEQIAQILQPGKYDDSEQAAGTKDPIRSLGSTRRAAVVLTAVGLGLIIFGLILTAILQVRPVLAVAASGLIPLAIGIGFFVDYGLQKRELARFGLEVGADLPSNHPSN
jgi:hypothetical protein